MGQYAGKIASPEQLAAIGRLAAAMVRPGDHVGLGSGKAALAFVRMLGRRIACEHLPVIGVPTSLLTEQVARDSGVPLGTLETVAELDLAVDGSDEVDPELNMLKGGGGNLTREKVIASIAKRLVIVVGEEKLVAHLGTHFPVFVEVIEFARPVVVRKLQSMGFTVTPRLNPDGTPFYTDNHNPYLECRLGAPPYCLLDPTALELSLRVIPGVVETGLFVGMADEVLIAKCDGTIERRG